MQSLFKRFTAFFQPAPRPRPRLYIDSSAFSPEEAAPPDAPRQESAPGRALILTTRNEAATIAARVQRALAGASGVVVVDCGSTDGTAYLAAQAGAVVVLQEPGVSRAAALAEAKRLARRISPRVAVLD